MLGIGSGLGEGLDSCLGFGPCVFLQDDQDDSESEAGDGEGEPEFPCITYVDEMPYVSVSESVMIPLNPKPGIAGNLVLLRAPSGEYYVDTDNHDTRWKPKYLAHLEKRYQEATQATPPGPNSTFGLLECRPFYTNLGGSLR